MKKIIAILLALMLLMTSAAFADHLEIKAEIPVSCVGIGGTFALFDGDEQVDQVHINSGGKDNLSVTLNALDYFSYTVRQIDMNKPNVDYDVTEYTVKVTTILDEDENPIACITVYEGVDSKKVDEIVFKNYNTDIPQTGDNSDMFLWGGLAAGSIGTIALLLIFAKKKKKENADA